MRQFLEKNLDLLNTFWRSLALMCHLHTPSRPTTLSRGPPRILDSIGFPIKTYLEWLLSHDSTILIFPSLYYEQSTLPHQTAASIPHLLMFSSPYLPILLRIFLLHFSKNLYIFLALYLVLASVNDSWPNHCFMKLYSSW